MVISPGLSEEPLPKGTDPNEAEIDWLEGYYLNPTPEKFTAQMREWAADGTLQNPEAQPTLIAFISQLMRQNRDQIPVWAKELDDLDSKDLVVFNTSLLFSRTVQADDLIVQALGDKYGEIKRPGKILELTLIAPPTMDMLWGYFYATGSEKAIRKIIQGFRFENAPLDPEGVEIPEGYKPYYTELPQISFSSLYFNILRHPGILGICEKIYESDETLVPPEKRNLHDLLSLTKPEKYPARKMVEPEDKPVKTP